MKANQAASCLPLPEVMLLVTTRKDAEITQRLLREVGLQGEVACTLTGLKAKAQEGAAAVLMTEEGIRSEDVNAFVDAVAVENGADLPTVLLTKGGVQSTLAASLLSRLQNLTILERPAPISSIMSAVASAVRVRQRQRELAAALASERRARLESERANSLKDEFLATLSHELRTPLNAIVGWVELMKYEVGNPVALQEGLQVIERNVRAQGQLIDDLLDVSRIISGKVRLEIKPLQLVEVIDAAMETVAPTAAVKGVRLEKLIPTQAPVVSGDFSRLQQVVWNLLTNAVKFTPKGGKVQVLMEQHGSVLDVHITDTGEGIETSFLPHVFERFRQADGTPSRRHGGLGLGLSIVKTLVEMHGGRVAVTSGGKGLGSSFTFTIPIRILHTAESKLESTTVRNSFATDRPDLSGLKILIVDDEPDARGMMRRLLGACRAVALEAASGSEAMAVIAAEQPALIVSDVGMPGMDGYEFISEVRRRGTSVPAIALTAFARSEDRVRAIQAGFQAHLAKPVETSELLALIASLCGRSPRNGGAF